VTEVGFGKTEVVFGPGPGFRPVALFAQRQCQQP
jgi:hypothetical protein